jgi:plasmid stability protein
MMSRTQVSLDPELHRKAKARAAELGVSLAEYLRTLVANDLGGETSPPDPSAVFDLGDSGGSDIARHRDAYVAEAVVGRRRGVGR